MGEHEDTRDSAASPAPAQGDTDERSKNEANSSAYDAMSFDQAEFQAPTPETEPAAQAPTAETSQAPTATTAPAALTAGAQGLAKLKGPSFSKPGPVPRSADRGRGADHLPRLQLRRGHRHHGASGGGRSRLLAVGVPTFGWTQKRLELCRSGSRRELRDFLDKHPDRRERVLETMGYFDTVHHAPNIRCQVSVGLGQRDDIVPPETVYAIVNHLGSAATVLEYPVSHSSEPEEQLWLDFERHWLDQACNSTSDRSGDAKIRPSG